MFVVNRGIVESIGGLELFAEAKRHCNREGGFFGVTKFTLPTGTREMIVGRVFFGPIDPPKPSTEVPICMP